MGHLRSSTHNFDFRACRPKATGVTNTASISIWILKKRKCRLGWMLVPVVLLLFAPKAVQAATNWTVALGAQSSDASVQAMAFLPNEVWIDAGDSVTWTSQTGEGHTVSFLLQP